MPDLTLFEPCEEPIGERSMARTESAYEYYRCSRRKSMEALKENLEVWFSSFPTEAKLDLQQRFRSRIKGQHDAAYFELHLHRLFTQMGFGLGVHPDLEGEKTHPDYLASRHGAPLFYLEATIARDSETEASEKQRANQVLEALEQLKSPDFSISIRVQVLQPRRRQVPSSGENWSNGSQLSNTKKLSLCGSPKTSIPCHGFYGNTRAGNSQLSPSQSLSKDVDRRVYAQLE